VIGGSVNAEEVESGDVGAWVVHDHEEGRVGRELGDEVGEASVKRGLRDGDRLAKVVVLQSRGSVYSSVSFGVKLLTSRASGHHRPFRFEAFSATTVERSV